MKLHVLFGQRKGRYLDEDAPEALACATEGDHQDNPNFLSGVLSENLELGQFESLRIVDLEIDGAKLMEILRPSGVSLAASIIG